MIKEYKKIIIMAVSLLVLVIGLVAVIASDIDFGLFKNLAIASLSDKKVTVDTLLQEEGAQKEKLESSLDKLEQAKNQYETEKKKFDNIDKSTIDLVKDATKDEKYFIEYLWIVLGNYADDNDLFINIHTPGSTQAPVEDAEGTEGENKQPAFESVADNTIRIVVRGRYPKVADFVYEVENDKELRFKLDNIKMTYTKNNEIEATFNVLSLQVKK